MDKDSIKNLITLEIINTLKETMITLSEPLGLNSSQKTEFLIEIIENLNKMAKATNITYITKGNNNESK